MKDQDVSHLFLVMWVLGPWRKQGKSSQRDIELFLVETGKLVHNKFLLHMAEELIAIQLQTLCY
jgi:hypothetical protein